MAVFSTNLLIYIHTDFEQTFLLEDSQSNSAKDLTGFTGLQPDTLERLKLFYKQRESSLKNKYPTFDSFIRLHIYPKIKEGSNE